MSGQGSAAQEQHREQSKPSTGQGLDIQTEAEPLKELAKVVRAGHQGEQTSSRNLVSFLFATSQALKNGIRLKWQILIGQLLLIG